MWILAFRKQTDILDRGLSVQLLAFASLCVLYTIHVLYDYNVDEAMKIYSDFRLAMNAHLLT